MMPYATLPTMNYDKALQKFELIQEISKTEEVYKVSLIPSLSIIQHWQQGTPEIMKNLPIILKRLR